MAVTMAAAGVDMQVGEVRAKAVAVAGLVKEIGLRSRQLLPAKGTKELTSQDWSFTVCRVVLSPFLTLATLAWVAYRLRYVLRT